MDNFPLRNRDSIKDNSVQWVNQETLDNVTTFTDKGGMDHAFSVLGPSSSYGVLPRERNRKVCNKYGGCFIPLQDCIFSLIGLCHPFNDFEVGVINHLTVAHSYLHPVRWVCVKVFQQWCEYKKSVPTLTLFFHLFNAQHSFFELARGQSLISFRKNCKMFEFFYESVKILKDRYYLVSPFTNMAHASI